MVQLTQLAGCFQQLSHEKGKFKNTVLASPGESPITHIEEIELRLVETLHEVIDSFSGQLTAFSMAPTSTVTANVTLPTCIWSSTSQKSLRNCSSWWTTVLASFFH